MDPSTISYFVGVVVGSLITLYIVKTDKENK